MGTNQRMPNIVGDFSFSRAKELVRTMGNLCDKSYTDDEVSSIADVLFRSIHCVSHRPARRRAGCL